jgi:GDP-L-fucose synthase
MLQLTDKIFVAGARGLLGSALVSELRDRGFNTVLTPSHAEGDLTDPAYVAWFFSVHEPKYVFLCAAKVGGIQANIDEPVDFFLKNVQIQNNVISNAAKYGVEKLVFLGSSCVYPRDCPQPIKEEYLLTGPFEKAVEAYGIAKVSGIKLCQWYHQRGHNFVSAMPCNLFGCRDNFDERTAHVIPGMMARMHRAKLAKAETFAVWGRPEITREFLFAPDAAKALMTVMEKYSSPEPINIGDGIEISMRDLAWFIRYVVGYSGHLRWDTDRPTGTPRKVMDVSKIKSLGWSPKYAIGEALKITYDYFDTNWCHSAP